MTSRALPAKKIVRLTADQTADLAATRDKWLEIGLSTDSIGRDRAKAAVAQMYECAGLAPPARYVFLQSPLAGAYEAASLAQVVAQVRNQVRDQVRAQVRAQVRNQVEAQVLDQVGAQVGAQVRNQVRNQVLDQVWAQVRNQVVDRVWAQVRDLVWDQVWAQVEDQVGRATYGGHDASWLGFYDFFSRNFGLAKEAAGLMALAAECGWVWPFEGAAIITDRPSAILLDEERRLHCGTGPAIKYRDGFSVYAWRGVRVPAHWIAAKDNLDPAEVLRTENVERRRAGCEILGWDRIIDALGGRIIAADPDPMIGTLVEVNLPGIGPSRFLRATCGTGRKFAMCVPRDVQTPFEAQAVLAGLPASEFVPPSIRT